MQVLIFTMTNQTELATEPRSKTECATQLS